MAQLRTRAHVPHACKWQIRGTSQLKFILKIIIIVNKNTTTLPYLVCRFFLFDNDSDLWSNGSQKDVDCAPCGCLKRDVKALVRLVGRVDRCSCNRLPHHWVDPIDIDSQLSSPGVVIAAASQHRWHRHGHRCVHLDRPDTVSNLFDGKLLASAFFDGELFGDHAGATTEVVSQEPIRFVLVLGDVERPSNR